MIGRTGIHAVRALAVLAALPGSNCAGAAAVAERIGAPPNYLGKLLQTLAREGLVTSRKGSGGGFRLARDPASIRLIDVISPFEPTERWDGCLFGLPECRDSSPCAVHHRWAELKLGYMNLLSETTIADLVARPDLV